MPNKPRKVVAKITRVVTEYSIITLTRAGEVDEYVELVEELDMDDIEVIHVRSVISEHD